MELDLHKCKMGHTHQGISEASLCDAQVSQLGQIAGAGTWVTTADSAEPPKPDAIVLYIVCEHGRDSQRCCVTCYRESLQTDIRSAQVSESASNEALAACQSEASGRIGALEAVLREIRKLSRSVIHTPTDLRSNSDGLLRKIISHCTVHLGGVMNEIE